MYNIGIRIPSDEIIALRKRLIEEEVVEELLQAMADKNIEKVADGIADSIYVLLGTAIAFGIDIEPIWDEVHKTNMQKQCSGDIHVKVLKPPGWKPPDIEKLLEDQGWNKGNQK